MTSLLSILETCGILMLIGFFLCGCFGWCYFNRRKHNGVVLSPPQPNVIVIQEPEGRNTNTGVYEWNTGRRQMQRLINYRVLIEKL